MMGRGLQPEACKACFTNLSGSERRMLYNTTYIWQELTCNSDRLGWYSEGRQFKLRWNISYPYGFVVGFLSGKRSIYGEFLATVELPFQKPYN